MLNRFIRLLSIFLIVGVALYLVILNREPLTVHLGSTTSFSTSSGVILIGVFSLGILLTALVALFFGAKAYWRERRLLGQEKQRQSFLQSLVEARGYLAAGDYTRAGALWEQVLKRDPANIMAKIELANCLEGNGETYEAARLMDAARATQSDNVEVLFKSAELNLKLGNRTAALDNLALILDRQPSRKAARLARELSEELGRFDDALNYEQKLQFLGGETEESARQVTTRLEYRKLMRETGSDKQKNLALLNDFARTHKDFAPALITMAQIRQEAGESDEAAQLLVRAANLEKTAAQWRAVQRLWLQFNKPEKALAAARTAVKELTDAEKLHAELDLAELLLKLEMLEEARQSLSDLISRGHEIAVNEQTARRLLALKALYFSIAGDHKRAATICRQISEGDWNTAAEPLEQTLRETDQVLGV